MSSQSVQKLHRSGTKHASRVTLETSCQISGTELLSQNLRGRVIGQDVATETLVCSYSRLMSGLRDPSRPLFTGLLLGPTGVGKTETAKALAQSLFGSERAMTRINCEQFAHAHELAKLLGSPPGYTGSHIEPLLSQNRIDEPHRLLWTHRSQHGYGAELLIDQLPPVLPGQFHAIILFDEIEKAHPVLWNALLGILEDGTLTLGDNSTTDFTRSIILVTSNVGSRAMSEMLEHRPVGFRNTDEAAPTETTSLREVALDAARSLFPNEFLNRFDETLVYSALEREHLERIFDRFLADIHERTIFQAKVPLLIKLSSEAKGLIVDRGSDMRFGARPLRRAVEKELVDPLSRLIASHRVHAGDVVEIERDGDVLRFYRRSRTSSLVVA